MSNKKFLKQVYSDFKIKEVLKQGQYFGEVSLRQ